MFKVIKPDNIVRTDDVVQIPDMQIPLPAKEENLEISPDISFEELQDSDIYKSIVNKGEEQGRRLSEKIISLANTERENILQQAMKKAEEINRQARIKLEQAEEIKASALQQGYNEGAGQKAGEIDEAISKIDQSLQQLRDEQTEYFLTYQEELKNLALDIAGKVIHKKISEDDMTLNELVSQAVSSIKGVKWISAEISDKLPRLAQKLRKELCENTGEGPSVEIRTKDIPEGSCIVQTSDGIIDASVSTQLDNLRKYMDSLS